jgi:hypothetical protein
MSVATTMCWFAWGYVIFNVDPFHSGMVGFLSFYASLFFALFGTVSLVGLWIYRKYDKSSPLFKLVEKSFRDSCLIAFMLILLLYLQGENLLTFWNVAILTIFIVLSGSFYLSVTD